MSNNDKLDSPAGKWTDEMWESVAKYLEEVQGKEIEAEAETDRRHREQLLQIKKEQDALRAELDERLAIPDPAERLKKLRQFETKAKLATIEHNFILMTIKPLDRRSRVRKVIDRIKGWFNYGQ